MTVTHAAMLASALTCALPAGAMAATLAVFDCREHLGLDWPRVLVTYHLDSREAVNAGTDPAVPNAATNRAFKQLSQPITPGTVQLVDGNGANVPFQFSRIHRNEDGDVIAARISFFAEMPKNGAFHYELISGAPSPEAESDVRVESSGAHLVLSNAVTGIRLPPAGTQTFEPPLPFQNSHDDMVRLYGRQAENGVVPGPLQGVRLNNREWVGGSYFWAKDPEDAPRVTGYECVIAEAGPLFVEASVHYTFDNGGFYKFTARVISGDPAVRIDEQFDTRQIGSGYTWRLITSLSNGWQQGGWRPDAVFWQSSQGRVPGHDAALEARLKAAGLDTTPYEKRDFGSKTIAYDKPFEKVVDLLAWNPWHQGVHYIGCVNTADLPDAPAEGAPAPANDATQTERIPFLGVIPMHAGNWRGNTQPGRIMVFTHGVGDFDISWPLMAEPYPKSLLHTGEFDPAVSESFMRRQWALMAGPARYHKSLYQFRSYDGHINLDDYKDWVVDWDSDGTTYPRLVFGPDDVERLRPTLDEHPGGDVLKEHLYFNDNAGRRDTLYARLTGDSPWSGPRGQAITAIKRGGDSRMPWVAHYRHTQMAGWIGSMDELLSSPSLPDDQRHELKTLLAVLCNVLSEPDFNPRGSEVHLGTPNMPINRFMALPFSAALIPNHPRAVEWLDVSDNYLRYKLAINTAPGGAWSELITYFAASAPHLMQGAAVLERTGRLSDETARLAALPARFTMQLLSPPDPRFGSRVIQAWGHEGLKLGTHWMVAASLMRNRDPELARAFAWCWDQIGRPMTEHHDAGFSERVVLHADLLKKLPPDYVPKWLSNVWLPGCGVQLRDGAGTDRETMLSYRQGYMVSHCDPNQGDFVLYANGAPLVTLSMFAYPLHQHDPYIELFDNFGWHSHVRLGDRNGKVGHWNASSEVYAYGFHDAADYFRGRKDQGDQTWTRQVLFLKRPAPGQPEYVLFRDSFEEPTAAWWTLRTPGDTTRLNATADGFTYTSPEGSMLDIRFLQPGPLTLESRQESRTGPLYHGVAANWLNAESPVVKVQNQHNVRVKETLTVTSAGPADPGRDIVAMLTPRAKNGEHPECRVLADGVIRVQTAASTDTVFVNSEPFEYTGGGIAFSGIAGAVRVQGEQVRLVILEGPTTITFGNITLSSQQPVERVFNVDDSKTVTIPAPAETGVYDIQVHDNRITGKIHGVAGGFEFIDAPAWLNHKPVLIMDGQTYAPGTAGNQLIVPHMPGDHTFSLENLPQPPIFRNWQAW